MAIGRIPLLRFTCLSENPHDLAPYGLSAPAAWFVHLAVFESWGRAVQRGAHLSHRLRSASEFDPSCRAPSCTLSRGFRSPSATQPPRSTTPGLSPARVTLRPRAYHAPRRLTPSTASLVLFSTRCAPGILALQSFPYAEVAAHLSVPAVPLAIGHAGPFSTHRRGRRCFELALDAGLASGLVPLPVGTCALDLLRSSRVLALLGFTSLGLSPSVLRPPGSCAIPRRLCARPVVPSSGKIPE